MRKVQNFGDDRNKGWCVHCGGPNETRDHGPPLIFLDDPLPRDLPTSPSCLDCNQSFSSDEAYVAALIECVLAGCADPSAIERPKVAALLRRRKSLQSDLRSARSERHGQTFHQADEKRIKSVVLKLGRCHVAHELNEPRPDEPRSVWWRPIMLMTAGQLDHFEHGDDGVLVPWPEVGSRAMMRMMMEGTNVFGSGWLEVQQGRYRFLVSQDGGLRVRMVIREYLACEVAWD